MYKETFKAELFRRSSDGIDLSIHLELAQSRHLACQLMITIEASDPLSRTVCLAGTSETQLHPDQVTTRLEEASHKQPVSYISHVTSTTYFLLGTALSFLVWSVDLCARPAQ